MNEDKEIIEIQTATFIKEHIKNIVDYCEKNEEELINLQDIEYSKNTFRLSGYSFLSLVKNVNKDRYWIEEYLINNATYLVCSQWGGSKINSNGISISQKKGDKSIEYLKNNNLLLDKYINKSIEFIVGSLETERLISHTL